MFVVINVNILSNSLCPLKGEEVPVISGEKLQRMSRDVTYLCPFGGPIKGNLYLTNYKLFFASKDRLTSFEVPLGVVRP
jgi:hypothetical protein